jgi:hypothetical protein
MPAAFSANLGGNQNGRFRALGWRQRAFIREASNVRNARPNHGRSTARLKTPKKRTNPSGASRFGAIVLILQIPILPQKLVEKVRNL